MQTFTGTVDMATVCNGLYSVPYLLYTYMYTHTHTHTHTHTNFDLFFQSFEVLTIYPVKLPVKKLTSEKFVVLKILHFYAGQNVVIASACQE